MRCVSEPSFGIARPILGIGVFVLLSALSLAAQAEQTFKGEITDSACAGSAVQAAMLIQDQTVARCTSASVKTGAKYVLSDRQNKTVYKLDDPMRAQAFAGQRVVIIGTLDKATGTIHVDDVNGALPPKVMQAVLVYVDCVDCPRGMAKAKNAALREVANWKRFYLVPDRRRADLIFLFSAIPYRGDYLTRDGDHPGLVPVEVTYMNIVDPRTGESLWGDSRKWGSWFVGPATKDLIAEFKARVDAEEGRFAQLLSYDKDQNRKAAPNQGK
jgi:hypothetical protein